MYAGVPKTAPAPVSAGPPAVSPAIRSEEHTSELQSQSNLVCRLLLEKKKKINNHPLLQTTKRPLKQIQHRLSHHNTQHHTPLQPPRDLATATCIDAPLRVLRDLRCTS